MDRKNKNPSIKDIARIAGVAISTVSFVINNRDFVSDKTREKVLKAIDELGYCPNTIAQSLRTKRTKTIGAIVYDISNPFVSQIVRGIEEVAKNRGYSIILGCTFNDAAEENRLVNVLINQFVDGLLIISGEDKIDIYQKIDIKKTPLVFVDREVGDIGNASVLVDNVNAVKNAVDYLCSIGHKEIGYISYPIKDQTVVKKRFEGYCKGLMSNGISFHQDLVIMDEIYFDKELEGKDMEITYSIMKKYISSKKIPTAFITISDIIAYGLLKALRVCNIQVPRQVSVIGFDNIVFDDFVYPSLSTIKQPKRLMGTTSINLLIDIIEKKQPGKQHIVLESELILRGSTGPSPNLMK